MNAQFVWGNRNYNICLISVSNSVFDQGTKTSFLNIEMCYGIAQLIVPRDLRPMCIEYRLCDADLKSSIFT